MRKINKKLIIVLIIIISVTFLTSNVQASGFNPNDYRPNSLTEVQGATQFQQLANKIIGMVQIVGSVTSVVALIAIGIKYILGSVEEKAEYKETLKPYVIGAIMVFGITNILALIQNLVASNFI